MFRKNHSYIFLLLYIPALALSKSVIDCRIVTNGITSCNPYSSKFIRGKEVTYDKDRKKLIVEKTLSIPKPKTPMKVVSVEDMIEKYVKVEEPLRYKGTISASFTPKEKLKKRDFTGKKKHTTSLIQEKKKSIVQSKVSKTNFLEVHKKAKVLRQRYAVYQVEKGDALSKIAQKFNLTTQELRRINSLENDTLLKIGQTLKIPLTQEKVDALRSGEYKVKPGDTLILIAQKFNLDPKKLAHFNHIDSPAMIHAGKNLKLPLPSIVRKLEKRAKAAIVEAKKRRMLKKRRKVKMLRQFGKHRLRVTATAYSSHRGQTDSTPFLAAWNNQLKPGMKIIAVSRDLLTRYGMRNGTKVKIGGLPGFYTVRDKMNKRYRKRIDIYMGTNRRKALKWGRRSVTISW